MVKNKFYVYQLRLETSELPFYIGKGCGDRMIKHFQPYQLSKKSYKNNIIKKAKRENVKILSEMLCCEMFEEDAYTYEKYLISKLGRVHNNSGILANHTDGGDGIRGLFKNPVSQETRDKIAASLLGHKMSEESVAKRTATRKKNGYKVSEETKEKIRLANKGKPVSVETRKKLSIANKLADKIGCPHCKKFYTKAHLNRYHGSNCKLITNKKFPANSSGEKSSFSKLKEFEVLEIRDKYSCGVASIDLAETYNVSQSTICRIIKRKTWQHI